MKLLDPRRSVAPDQPWSGSGWAGPTTSGPVAEHRLARLHPDLVLLELATGGDLPQGAATLSVQGRMLPPPSASLILGGAEAPRLLFVARDRDGLLQPGAICEARRGDVPLARFLCDVPVPAEALLLQRDAAEQESLLRFLVATCAPLLRAGALAEFTSLCHGLARALLRQAGTAVARPLCRPGAALSLWGIPGGAAPGSWHLITRGGLQRLPAPKGNLLLLDGPVPAGSVLLPPAPGGPIGFAELGAHLPPLPAFIRRAVSGEAGAPRRALPQLALRASQDPRCAALLREAQLLSPARPKRLEDPVAPVGGALELALSDAGGGLFLCGWLRDPLNLITALELQSGLGNRPVPTALLHRVARPDLAEGFAKAAYGGGGAAPGFIAHLPRADHAAVGQWRLSLRLGSGEAVELVAPPARLQPAQARDLVLRSVHPAAMRPGLLENVIAPAAARLHRAALAANAQAPTVLHFGKPVRRPKAALVIPLYRNLRFLRFQIGAFARDAGTAATELVFVLDSPEQRGEVEHLLRGLAMLYGDISLTLVVMPENRGYASACNAGAAACTAPVLLLLNSDVLPAAPGWLAPLLKRLSRERRLAALGPKLLFDNGTIQHAGLLFRRGEDGEWLNDHYFKGFPRHYAPACQPCRVPAVTGAALCVRRHAFEAVGGFSTDYVVGDFEDSDLCLKLRAAGGEIGYEPASELYHFERQSIGAHAGHARTLAGSYNRLLHHQRWNAEMAALMARFPAG